MQINTKQKNNFLTSLDFIITSSSDASQLETSWIKPIKIARTIYWFVLVFFLSISFVPLFFHEQANQPLIIFLNLFTGFILLVDLILRWLIYPFGKNRINKNVYLSFIKFPITIVGVILILSVLPTIVALFGFSKDVSFQNFIAKVGSILLIFRILRYVLLLNIFTLFNSVAQVFRKQGPILFNVFIFIIVFTLLFAGILFKIEKDIVNPGQSPDQAQIKTYWDALYFAGISLTTIGYGDITPSTNAGRALVLIVSFFGIAIFAIPSGIIAGGFITEVKSKVNQPKKSKK